MDGDNHEPPCPQDTIQAIADWKNGVVQQLTSVLQTGLANSTRNADQPNSKSWYKNWVQTWQSAFPEPREIDPNAPSPVEPQAIPLNELSKDPLIQEIAEKEMELHSHALSRAFSFKESRDRFIAHSIQKYGDVVKLVKTYCSDWEDSPMDILTFFLCLAAFSGAQVHRKERAVYDDKLLMEGYAYSHYAFASYGGSRSRVLKRLPLLQPSNFVAGCWDKVTLGIAPAWFVACDPDREAVILSLRGTTRLDDILVDLTAQYTAWHDGYAHRGFVKSLRRLEPQVLDIVTQCMKDHPGYSLRICGHSMGAAVAALLAFEWVDKYPEWNVRGYGYATPCCLSKHLIEKSKEFFVTFVHHFDAVTRLSMGSIQDLHNGMRLFTKRVGRSHNVVAIYHAMKKLALNAESKRIISTASEINDLINDKLQEEWSQDDPISHLYPAGTVYQFWRETKGKDLTIFEMHQGDSDKYGRLQFSPTMLSDHGSPGYTRAFESLLAISVVERQVWMRMSSHKRDRIRDYWASYPNEDLFAPGADPSLAIRMMDKPSKYKQRCYEMGQIRPFLLLVSMSPRRRAAVAKLMGISLVQEHWYCLFDPHKEAWKIISGKRGFTSRANGILRSINPLAEHTSWYEIVYMCCGIVKDSQKQWLNPQVVNMLHGKRKSHHQAMKASIKIEDDSCSLLEEIFMLLLFSVSEQASTTNHNDPLASFSSLLPTSPELLEAPSLEELVEEMPNHNSMPSLVACESPLPESEVPTPSPKQGRSRTSSFNSGSPSASPSPSALRRNDSYHRLAEDKSTQQLMIELSRLGFVSDLFLKYVAKQHLECSFQQRANEFYTWSNTIRKKEDRIKKRHVVGVLGLAAVSLTLVVSIIPLITITPPLALIPATASIGIGLYAYNKSAPGALISMIVGLLQQRLALANHGIDLKKYYF